MGLVAAAACDAPVVPDRLPRFSFADTVGGAPVVFHWHAAELPVRFYAPPEGGLQELVRRALASWEAQLLYGELRTVVGADSSSADVIVTFQGAAAPAGAPDTASRAPACDGVTTATFAATDTIELPIRTTLRWFAGYGAGEILACLARVAPHEIGHTLGFFNGAHAGTGLGDLMYPTPQVYLPGPRDRATLEVLYHTPRTAVPGARP